MKGGLSVCALFALVVLRCGGDGTYDSDEDSLVFEVDIGDGEAG